MKRFLSVLAASALLVTLAAVAAAQDAKDKAAPPKDKADKAPATKEKSSKETAPEKAPVAAAPQSTEYYPLQVGNIWYYRVGDNRYSLKVAKYEKIGGLNCARVEMSVDDKVTSVEHIAVTSDGVARAAFGDAKESKEAVPPLVFLKLPPKKGAEWKVDSVVGKTDKVPGEKVIGTFKEDEVAKVSVPAGTYEKVITSSSQDLDANGMKLKFTYYFAKDVGMVKQEILVAGQTVVIELEKFDPATPPAKQ
jgi:hypothetical protein